MAILFKGAGVALITPFNEDLSVNYDKLGELIEEQIAGGTDAIISMGTTGEAATLSHEEHLEVIKYTCEKVAGRIPVIAGTGSNSTDTAIYLSVEAKKYGVDGLLLATPYYNKATQKGLIKHFREVAKAVGDLPILLYNIPGRTGINMNPETTAYLVKNVDNIVGIKEASSNFSAIAKLLSLMGDTPIDLYSGNDDQIVPMMALGGVGVISVLSNVAPRQTHDMCMAALEGDFKKAAKLQVEAVELIDNLFIEVNPIPVKMAMNLQGKNVGTLRMPLTDLEEEHTKTLEKSMKSYGIL
jgi:dihydrodipicolinate synthase